MSAPALLTALDLRRWFAGLGLTAGERPRLQALNRPITFTTPQGDHWTITPLISGAYLVAPGLHGDDDTRGLVQAAQAARKASTQ